MTVSLNFGHSLAEGHSRCILPSSPGRFMAQHVAPPLLDVDIVDAVVAAVGGSQ